MSIDKKESPFLDFFRYEKEGQKVEGKEEKPKVDERTNFGNYLFGSGYEDPSDIDGTEPTNWTSYTNGRIAIRLFSRGILGAGLYTVANRAIGPMLKDYNHMSGFFSQKNGLQYIARTIDGTISPVIQQTTRLLSRGEKAQVNAANSTWFRPGSDHIISTVFKTGENGEIIKEAGKAVLEQKHGRSLGSEMVSMTFDFAAGSVGDATGRQIAAMADPNRPNSWEEKDGSINKKKFIDATLRNAWDIISLKQGEDWAAALPYVYQMRLQRNAINKLYPGFKLVGDKELAGGSMRLNQHGEIIGSYAKAGALDLQLRFTGYNWYTLMYRDFYRTVSDGWHALKDHDYQLPSFHMPYNPALTVLDGLGYTIRYTAKSMIKATIYMTPAVPFFWLTRTPQAKAKGANIMISDEVTERGDPKFVNKDGRAFTYERTLSDVGDLHGAHIDPKEFEMEGHTSFTSEALGNNYYPYDRKHVRGIFDAFTNPFGEACYKMGEGLNNVLRRVGFGKRYPAYTRQFARTYVDASASYTPYMIAKAETALRWDRPSANGVNLMDNAIYRFLDGISSLNLTEVTGGLSDVRDVIIHPPSNEKVKEVDEEVTKQKQEAEELENADVRLDQIKNAAKKANDPNPKVLSDSVEIDGGVVASKAKTAKSSGKSEGGFVERIDIDTTLPPNTTIH